jgi:hypothetical protein
MLRELLSLLGQETRLLRLTTPLGPDLLTPECVRGEEALSGGFRFRITALSPDAGLSLRALLGHRPCWNCKPRWPKPGLSMATSPAPRPMAPTAAWRATR